MTAFEGAVSSPGPGVGLPDFDLREKSPLTICDVCVTDIGERSRSEGDTS